MVHTYSKLIDRTVSENSHYIYGDQFIFWAGPTWPDSDKEFAQKINEEIARQFVNSNILAEIIDQYTSALISQFPLWYFKNSEGDRLEKEDRVASDADKLVQRWLDWVKQQASSQTVDQGDPWIELVENRLIEGFGQGRLYQPKRYANAKKPFQKLFVHAAKTGSVEMVRDDDGFLERIKYRYGEGYVETQRLALEDGFDEETGLTVEEGDLIFVITKDEQIVSPVNPSNGQPTDSVFLVKTGGRWMIYEIKGESLLTKDLKRLQNQLNCSLTYMGRSQEQGGFLERAALNVQPPGDFVEDETGKKRFVKDPKGWLISPGQMKYYQAVNIGTEEEPEYPPAQLERWDPVPVTSFEEAIQVYRTFMYLKANLGHLLSAGDGSLSGVSRIQLKADFISALEKYKPIIEGAIAGILNAALQILDVNQEFQDIEAVVELRLTTGPLLPEEIDEIINQYKEGLLSRTTAMAKLGVDDPDAEADLIRAERREREGLNVANTLISTGSTDQPSVIEMLRETGNLPPNFSATAAPDRVLNGNGNGNVNGAAASV